MKKLNTENLYIKIIDMFIMVPIIFPKSFLFLLNILRFGIVELIFKYIKTGIRPINEPNNIEINTSLPAFLNSMTSLTLR